MISIIITSYNEPQTIGKAIESFINQKIEEDYELIVCAPDIETLKVASNFKLKNNKIRLIKDHGTGKSYALNLLLKKVEGEISILTDGDVFVSNNSVDEILNIFKNKDVGCVTGRPIPLEDKTTKYGYWANFLFDAAHKLRKDLKNKNKFLECSGYLWAFRNNIIDSFPLDTAEDSIIPYLFWKKGYKIAYADKAEVYVKNTNNWEDWLNQKIRTSRAHETLNRYIESEKRTKTFLKESLGVFYLFSYPRKIKEFFWSIELMLARFYVWLKVFRDVYIKKISHKDKWERIESTK